MINFLLFISIANLVLSILIAPPENRKDGLYFTKYTNAAFKWTMFFILLALIF